MLLSFSTVLVAQTQIVFPITSESVFVSQGVGKRSATNQTGGQVSHRYRLLPVEGRASVGRGEGGSSG